jgi:hypothetical protein
MSKHEVKEATIEPKVSIDLTFTKEDIIAIKISEIENAALAEIEKLSDANNEFSKEHSDIIKKRDDALGAYCKKNYNNFGADLEEALKVHYETIRRNVQFDMRRSSEDKCDDDNTKNVVRIVVQIQGFAKSGQRLASAELFKEVPIPAFYHDESVNAKKIHEKIEVNTNKIFEQKRILAQLAITERRARAEIARSMLGGSQGARILETLAGVGNKVKLLG